MNGPRAWRLWRCQTGEHRACRWSAARLLCGCPCHYVTVLATREVHGLPPIEECAHDVR